MTPILCIGESLEEREGGRAERVVESQLRAGLEGVEVGSGIVVAYEPVWAIGTGRSASPVDRAGDDGTHSRRRSRRLVARVRRRKCHCFMVGA